MSLQLGEGRGRSLRRTRWWGRIVQVGKDWENIKCGQATNKPRRPQKKEERKVEVERIKQQIVQEEEVGLPR